MYLCSAVIVREINITKWRAQQTKRVLLRVRVDHETIFHVAVVAMSHIHNKAAEHTQNIIHIIINHFQIKQVTSHLLYQPICRFPIWLTVQP